MDQQDLQVLALPFPQGVPGYLDFCSVGRGNNAPDGDIQIDVNKSPDQISSNKSNQILSPILPSESQGTQGGFSKDALRKRQGQDPRLADPSPPDTCKFKKQNLIYSVTRKLKAVELGSKLTTALPIELLRHCFCYHPKNVKKSLNIL